MFSGGRGRLAVVISALMIFGLVGAVPAVSEVESESGYAIVELASPSTVHYNGGIKGLDGTHPQNGRFDPASKAFASYQKHLENEHANFRASLGRSAPAAVVTREFFVTANAVVVELNGTSLKQLRSLKGVKDVSPSSLYRPTMDQSAGLIGTDEIWDVVGRYDAGAGVKVGVIDSGIIASLDPESHEFFECKDVVFAGIYYSGVTGAPGAEKNSDNARDPSPNVAYVFDHGTHVAGTIGGCVTTISSGFWDGTTVSGVAPGVTLYDYNVFPGIGAGYVAFGGSAFSHDIASAIEDSVLDGMDVINMSLGGSVQGPHDFLAEVANAASEAGVVVVTSAGNEGPGNYTVGSPGSAENVIAVAASTNTRGAGSQVIVPEGPTYESYVGEFDSFDGAAYTVADWSGSDNEACSDTGAESHTGEVVLIARGTCNFSQKVANAKAAGAVGVIVYSDSRDPGGMATSPGYDDDIPAVMISNADGLELEGLAPVESVVLTAVIVVPQTPNLIAGFSSRGPASFTANVKPDVMAPGVNILSSVFVGYELFNGTSMASPHVAGTAALLIADHPDWTVEQVESAIVTTAISLGYQVWEEGAGLVNVPAATDATVFFAPTNASFGAFKGKAPANGSVDITVTNGDGCSASDTSDFIEASMSNDTLTVDFIGSRTVGTGLHNGIVTVDCGGNGTYSIVWGAAVDR